jgi:hypothetical protein
MYKAGDTVIVHINDAHAYKFKAKLIKPVLGKILGHQIWRAEVLENIQKSKAGGTRKVGSKIDISAKFFTTKVK